MRIALLVTCVNDIVYPETGRAVVNVLEDLGHQVVFPRAQTCCGQMHINSGYPEAGLRLARGLVATFARYEAVVVPSASCAATITHLYSPLAEESGSWRLADDARALAARTYELSQLLVDVLGVTDVGAYFPHRVTYHPTCHSLRSLCLGDRPLRLLKAVDGLQLVDLADAASCCGFGGTFALKNAPTSMAMVADKLAHVQASGAEVLCAVDNSCLAHIGGASSRLGTGLAVKHLAEILASKRSQS